jgi:hypothetical protein
MKLILILLATCSLTLAACVIDNDPDPTGPSGPSGPAPGGEDCPLTQNCFCPPDQSCAHTCTPGAFECHVQGSIGFPTNVQCTDNAECHVQCAQASSCTVDCGGSDQCHVTCPPTGCTVTNCVGDCEVTCGLVNVATHVGSTATCP